MMMHFPGQGIKRKVIKSKKVKGEINIYPSTDMQILDSTVEGQITEKGLSA